MFLLSTKKEEDLLYIWKKILPIEDMPLFFSSFGGGEKGFPVSFAGGEIQLPVSRITRRFNRDKLSAPLCTYDKLWITDVTGNRLFWFIKCLDPKQKKMGHRWPVDTHGLWQLGSWREAERALLLILNEKVNHSLISFLLIMHFCLGMVNIYHECFLMPNIYYENLQTHWKVVRILQWVPVYLPLGILSSIVCSACFILFLHICLSYPFINPYYYFWMHFNICCRQSWVLLLSTVIQDSNFSCFRHFFLNPKGPLQWL